MDLDGQESIKRIVDQYGRDELVVILGSPDAESSAIYAETVTQGDPSYAGPLAGVSLGLPVFHILEPTIKGQIDPATYQEQVGPMELALDAEGIQSELSRLRE